MSRPWPGPPYGQCRGVVFGDGNVLEPAKLATTIISHLLEADQHDQLSLAS